MAKKIELKKSAAKKEDKNAPAATFVFGKDNYIIMLIGIGVLVIGYLLMIGGGSDTPDKFNPEIFSARRITVAPITLLIGFAVVLYGIMKKPKTEEDSNASTSPENSVKAYESTTESSTKGM